MAKPRSTYQQRLFADEELGLQSHDKIVRWVDLTLRDNPQIILESLNVDHSINDDGQAVAWSKHDYWDDLEYADSDVKKASRLFASKNWPRLPAPPPVQVKDILWEPIIKNDRGTVVGALDLKATILIPTPILVLTAEAVPY